MWGDVSVIVGCETGSFETGLNEERDQVRGERSQRERSEMRTRDGRGTTKARKQNERENMYTNKNKKRDKKNMKEKNQPLHDARDSSAQQQHQQHPPKNSYEGATGRERG